MGVRHIGCENMEQGILLFDPFSQGEVGRLRAMGDIGVFLVVLNQQLIHIVKRHPETGMHAPGLFQPHLQELGVDHFPDQRASDGFNLTGLDGHLDIPADLFGGVTIDKGFAQQGINYALPVPAEHVVLERPDKKGNISAVLVYDLLDLGLDGFSV